MNIEISDPIGALVVLAVFVLMAWIIVYSASRMAIADVIASPVVIVAAAWERGDRVGLTLTNSGSRTAYDLRLTRGGRGQAGETGPEIAVVRILAPGVPIQVEVARSGLLAEDDPPGAPLPPMLRASWRKSAFPHAAAAFDDIPVVVIEPPAATDGA